MKIILATSNRGKVREISELFAGEDVVPFTELLGPMEIVENGEDFAQNALIKARAVYEKLPEGDFIAVSDDSGITVPALGNEPGIFSARYAGEGATDIQNLQKLVDGLRSRGISKTPAYYTAAVAVVSPQGEYLVHGWMHGDVIDEPRGDGGFGYDPIFIPEGYEETLGELDPSIKREISHRSRALQLAKPIIEMLRGIDA